MGTAVVPVRNTIAERVNGADMVVMDETGWRVDGLSAWLWVATTADATVSDVAEGRGFDQACGLVDADYPGVIVRDGWAPYRRYETADHQTCLAHLLRRCHHMVERISPPGRGAPPDTSPESPTGGTSKQSAPPWSTARSGAGTAPGAARPPSPSS